MRDCARRSIARRTAIVLPTLTMAIALWLQFPQSDLLNRTVAAMPGYAPTMFGKTSSDPQVTDFLIGSHSTGDFGHGSGPWMGPVAPGFNNTLRLGEPIKSTNFFAIEFYASTAIPEWGGKKITVPLEDDAVVTERGVEWTYPPTATSFS